RRGVPWHDGYWDPNGRSPRSGGGREGHAGRGAIGGPTATPPPPCRIARHGPGRIRSVCKVNGGHQRGDLTHHGHHRAALESALARIRTGMPCGAAPSRQCVYQFHHQGGPTKREDKVESTPGGGNHARSVSPVTPVG